MDFKGYNVIPTFNYYLINRLYIHVRLLTEMVLYAYMYVCMYVYKVINNVFTVCLCMYVASYSSIPI